MIKLYRLRFKNGHRAKVVASTLSAALSALGAHVGDLDTASDAIEIREDHGWVIERTWVNESVPEAKAARGQEPPGACF